MQYAHDTESQSLSPAPLGDALRAWRMAAGFRQAVAAKRIGIAQPTLSQWESGRALPGTQKLSELAHLYGIGALELGSAVRGLVLPVDQ